ncbi:BrnT family toxin [Sinorhizobium medicae]|uniref:BrnT family toxin n=1 Tax=Sinorhizobium medicae TaxID=110321 RepID=UPI000400E220|nr:BrnT family toxin [Sinorhizobium medicae]WQP05896.1 BrnT family toxin [Sinorhizobium meliloti]MDX0428030.1 BrnT family toxin [Sinorhizobium medicae]MDX0987700.1 BrnT family toxin [Sinorhizobium medicae]MDX1075283.1 BrnT family toxin [Sinorhizobium medicae]WQP19201.1 BrnT family toxin [Sinorhizobium meliloti]
MDFEFDPAKSATNLEKHGIDFDAAQALWLDDRLLEVPAKTEDEPRSLAIGQINGKHWTAVFTYRGTAIRIISVRRSREKEIEQYESL